MERGPTCWLSLLVVGAVGSMSPPAAAEGDLPPPASHQVDFADEIKPILEEHCTQCHGRGRSKSDFRINTRETLLKGGKHEQPAVIPGESAGSLLIEAVAGVNPDLPQMPKKGKLLTDAEIGLLRAWIDQGVEWEEGFAFDRPPPKNLHPHKPELPPAPEEPSNPIDRLLQPYFAENGIQPPEPVGDRRFARRVYLDLVGLLPPPDELERFLADERPDKRARLVDRLLARDQQYAEHWLSFWNDLLRNDYTGPGYIDGGREEITPWLYRALAENRPYDELVRKLANPSPESRGFVKGIVWRGAVNASQEPPMQAGRNISQVFLGEKLKCASCHDSFVDNWRLEDAYGMAGIYAEGSLEIARCDQPTGRDAVPRFLFPELGEIDPDADRSARMEQLAEILVGPENGRLSRTIVNRLWAELMGRGLVEPLDVMNQPAWHQGLLDWLAADLVDHDYDLKHTLRRIVTSRAYQLPATELEERHAEDYVFRGPAVRRLTAEQQVDAVMAMTGAWRTFPANRRIDFNASENGQADSPKYLPEDEPKWLWSSPDATEGVKAGTLFLRKTVELPDVPTHASAVCTADNEFTLYVNGDRVRANGRWNEPEIIDIRPYLRSGRNVFAAEVTNAGADGNGAEEANPAGFLFYARLRHLPPGADGRSEQVWDVRSDGSWVCRVEVPEDWTEPELQGDNWEAATELGGLETAPWGYRDAFERAYSVAAQYGRVRASLVASDPLMKALGRPARQNVVSTREEGASTLQALELTNGETLNSLLKQGAKNLVRQDWSSGAELVETIYQHALSRRPTAQELALGTEMVGEPIDREGVEDWVWAVLMLPEFQLID